jgi:hypothetical protein
MAKNNDNPANWLEKIGKSPELKKITAIIKQNDLLKNRKLIKKGFEGILYIILKLCIENEIDFQYYTVKYLEMDWYKKKRPKLAFNVFYRNCRFAFEKGKELDYLLNEFFDAYAV